MFAPGWSVQGDIFGNRADNANDSFDYGDFGGALHLSKRAPTHLIGVFIGFSSRRQQRGPNLGAFFYGGEGQIHLGNATLYGQIGGIGSTAPAATRSTTSSAVP